MGDSLPPVNSSEFLVFYQPSTQAFSRRSLDLSRNFETSLHEKSRPRANFPFTPTSRWRTFVFFINLNNLLRFQVHKASNIKS